MKDFLAICWAEAKKGHHINFHNSLIYFSLLIWPAIMFVSAYYSFKPFNMTESSPLSRFVEPDNIALFLLTGYLGYIFFWSLVQSGLFMSYERFSGTLELIFLTPVSRIGMIYGRAAANLLEGIWLFFTFSVLTAFFIDGLHIAGWWSIPLALFLLTLSAIIWGGLLTTIFLFSRDAGIVYTILDEPMVIFSGVKIPTLALPIWGKAIALVFPLTYVLEILRSLVMEGKTPREILPQLGLLFVILFCMVCVSIWLLHKAEDHAKQTGSLALF